MRRLLAMVLCLMVCMMPFAPMASAATMGTVDTGSSSGVNLRVGPGGTVKGWVPEKTSVEILASSGNWYRVRVHGAWAPKNGYSTSNSVGYIYKTYVVTGSNKKSSNVANNLGITGTVARTKTSVVMRRGAGNGYGKAGTLSAGTKLIVQQTVGSWLRVVAVRSGGNLSGYVPKSAVAKGIGGTISTACNIRSGSSSKFGSIGTIPAGASVTVYYVGSSWSQVRYGNKTGYVNNSYLKLK